MISNFSLEDFVKEFVPYNAICYFGNKYDDLSEGRLDPNKFKEDIKSIKYIENMMYYVSKYSDDKHIDELSKFPINVGSYLNLLKVYVGLNTNTQISSMIYYSLHSVYNTDKECFFFMITTDIGIILIDKYTGIRFFTNKITELNNSDKVLSLERIKGNNSRFKCIQYGCYDYNSQTHFIVKPYSSQFHIFNKNFDNTYDFYFSRKYSDKKVITRSLTDLYQNENTILFCDKMGHINMTTSPEPQTMTLDGYSLGFNGSIKWSNDNTDSIQFSIRGEVKLDDILHPDFLFKVTSITDNKEDIKFNVLRNEINAHDNIMTNVGYKDIEYNKLANGTTNAMTISHLNHSFLKSKSSNDSIALANTCNTNFIICRNKGDLDLITNINEDVNKYCYSVTLLADINDTSTFNHKDKYLIVDSRKFNHNSNNEDYHFYYHDYPDISAVEVIDDLLIIIGRAYPMKYTTNNRIDYKLIVACNDKKEPTFRLIFKSKDRLTNAKFKIDKFDYFRSSNDKSIITDEISIIEPDKLYVVEFEL